VWPADDGGQLTTAKECLTMSNVANEGPWQRPTGDLQSVIVSGRPECCCLACAEESTSWNPEACLASVYCTHAATGWNVILFANTRTTAGQWQAFAGSLDAFVDWQAWRSREAAETVKQLRSAGGDFTLYKLDQ